MKRQTTAYHPNKKAGDLVRLPVDIPAELMQRINALTPRWGERTALVVQALRREVERLEAESKKSNQ